MARRPLEGEGLYLDGGRRTTQLMRDSLGGVDMTYRVRVYCHASFAGQACPHEPRHPFMLPEQFPSVRAANDNGGAFVDTTRDEDVEWEVLDAEGNVVC